MNLQRRNPVFDIMRGIGILLVVLGHAGFPFSGWIYLFHMPLFFLLSGWFTNRNTPFPYPVCCTAGKARFSPCGFPL